jgi:hypothetical protein
MSEEFTKEEKARRAEQIRMDQEYFSLPYAYRKKVSFNTHFRINGEL